MRKLLSPLLAALLLCGSALAQQRFTPYPTPNLRFETPPPLLPTNVTANYSGAFGSNTFFYWVIAQHTRGASGLSVPARVRNVGTLAGGNPVIISWRAVNGANTYDVIRFTSAAIVLPCAACRVATGVTGTSTSDTGAALGAQTLAPIGFAEAVYRLDNSTFTTAQMVYELPPSGATFFPMVVSTAGGGGADQDIPCFQGAGGTLGPCDTGDFFWTPATFLLNFPAAGGITSPAAAAADAGFVRMANAEVIAWEAAPAGVDETLTVSAAENFQMSGPLELDAADPADAGALRLDNNERIGWEASPAGVDGQLNFDTLENFSFNNPLEIDATDPADSQALRFDNAEGIAWEAAPAAADITLLVDASEILQASGAMNVGGALTEATNPVPNDTDNLGFFAATTSAQFAGVISDETGTLLVVLSDAPTFTTSTVSPAYISANADPADAGAVRLGNTELIGWELAAPGADITLSVDASDIMQSSGAMNVGGALTEATNPVPNDTDTLDFFAATTSAELITVISDETGSGLLTFATAPTFTTSTISPAYISADADPADAGVLRLGNTEIIGWELAVAGADITLLVDASDIMQSSGTFNAAVLTEGANAVPNVTDTLDVFATTTSAEMITVISDETGSGLLTFATAPTFTTSITVAGSLDISSAGSIISFSSVNVASVAGTMVLPAGNLFHVTGTNAITAVDTCDAANGGRMVTLWFDDILTFTDGNNLVLAGNFVTTADDLILLHCDGSNWGEVSRSIN